MTKLCPRGKAAAKRKFAVYPSAYANAYASKICAGKIKDPSGKKRKDFRGPKKAALGAIIGFGAAALGKKMLGKKTKQAMPQKGIGPITTMAEKQAKKRKEFMGMSKGGGADTGTVGEMKSKFGVTLNKARRFARKIRDTDRLTESDIRKAKDMLKNPKGKALNITKRSIDILKSSKKQGGMMKYNKGGMADYYKDLM